MKTLSAERVPRTTWIAASWAAVLGILVLIGLGNYLLFHTLAEFFSILVACGIFAFTLNTRYLYQNNCFTLLGLAYLCVAIVDLIHLLTFPGIAIIQGSGANLSAQLWLSARLLEGAALLLAPLFLSRPLRFSLAALACLGLTALLLLTIFWWPVFPLCYIPGQGLTTFKIGGELLVIACLMLALVHMYAKRASFDRLVLIQLMASISLTVTAEIFFSLYTQAFSPLNMTGHILKIVSYYLIYRAIVVTGLHTPYALLTHDLKAKEKQLQTTEERFRKIIEDQSELICRFMADGTMTFANNSYCRLFQRSLSEILGKPFSSMFPRDEYQSFREAFERITPENPVQAATHSLDISGSERHWLSWTIRGIFDNSGQVLEYQIVGRDMTELQNALIELEKSREYYRLLADEAPISILAFNAAGDITFVNRWHLKVFSNHALTEEACLGRKVWELPDLVQAGIAEELKPIPGGRTVDKSEVAFPAPDGSGRRYANIRGVPLIQNGRAQGGILISEDITGHKELELELAKTNQAKTSFLANVSHEIRTPMNAMLGMIQLTLDQGGLSPQDRERLEVARTSGESLLALIDELLDMVRIDSGDIKVEAKPFAPAELLKSIIQEMGWFSEKKGIRLDLNLSEGLPGCVVGDPLRLRQVLRNLISNAIKFTEEGEVRLQAEALDGQEALGESSGGSSRLAFLVSDTGPGIAPDKQEAVFQAFTRLSAEGSSDERTKSGTGLGLTITKRLVEHLGGSIRLESQPGRGSTFTVTMPFGRMETCGTEPREALRERPVDLPPLKVLLVEDQRMNQIFTKDLLETHGHNVAIAEDGWQALDTLREEAFDLVLMDIRMPGMDGLETTRRIRRAEAGERQAGIAIVALSANIVSDDLEVYEQAGLDATILKPIKEEDLFRTMERALQARSAHAADADPKAFGP